MDDGLLAVILDLDGVLVDSEPVHLQAWEQTLAERGATLPADFVPRSRGRRSREVAAWLAALVGVDAERLLRRRNAIVEQLADRIRPFADVAEAVEILRASRMRLAVGSSGTREHVLRSVEQVGLSDAVEAVVSGDDVARGKPEPDIFVACADALRLPPARIGVVEDAPNGVAAARAAGMTVVGLRRDSLLPLGADHDTASLPEAASWLVARRSAATCGGQVD